MMKHWSSLANDSLVEARFILLLFFLFAKESRWWYLMLARSILDGGHRSQNWRLLTNKSTVFLLSELHFMGWYYKFSWEFSCWAHSRRLSIFFLLGLLLWRVVLWIWLPLLWLLEQVYLVTNYFILVAGKKSHSVELVSYQLVWDLTPKLRLFNLRQFIILLSRHLCRNWLEFDLTLFDLS